MAKKYANKYARAMALVKEKEQNVESVREHAIAILDGFENYINNEAVDASVWVRNALKQGKKILYNYFVRVITKNENKDEENENFVQGGGIND